MNAPTQPAIWKQTASGVVWPVLEPTADHVRIDDIARALSQVCRYGGHTTRFYSVAEHSCHVSDAMGKDPEDRLYGLLHDAHEAYIGDMTTPVKLALQELGSFEAWEILEHRTDQAIFEYAKIAPMAGHTRQKVKQQDMTALATEKRDLLAEGAEWANLPKPWGFHVHCWHPQEAYNQFMRRWTDIQHERGAL